jgi:hypothetical protein
MLQDRTPIALTDHSYLTAATLMFCSDSRDAGRRRFSTPSPGCRAAIGAWETLSVGVPALLVGTITAACDAGHPSGQSVEVVDVATPRRYRSRCGRVPPRDEVQQHPGFRDIPPPSVTLGHMYASWWTRTRRSL